jgi:hypothetical protein
MVIGEWSPSERPDPLSGCVRLYVLKRNIYISIGVGSPGDQAIKIQKSKALAEIVLKRL